MGQVHCVSVVIGVVHGELHVTRVVPTVVCWQPLFSLEPFYVGFCCIGGILFTPPVGDSKLSWLLPNFEL